MRKIKTVYQSYEDLPPGAVGEVGLSVLNKVSAWRSNKPIIELEKCVACDLCWIHCPESAIAMKERKPVVDYDYCKGCGICEDVCPPRIIRMVPEVTPRGI